jgi:NADPH-dependent F420 reductase
MKPSKVAVLGGTGAEGGGLARRWGAAGIHVVIGSREQARAEHAAADYAQALPEATFEGFSNPDAAAGSDLVVLTVPFAGQAALCKSIAGSVKEGAVIVDCTVPVAAAVGGKATQVLGVPAGSAAQQAKSLLGDGVNVCSAFHSLSATALADPDFVFEADVLVCGPKSTKEPVRALVEAIPGLRFVDAGGLSTSAIVEPITALLIGINHRYKTDRSGFRITGI